ncbi:hypothetical protein CHARACLAT_016138 [Characodon lateralis]|uniref:Uncharacterized protein n=1 Tax=Characodon lateralis TaxID=208331 RepID=A0ABU7DA07_9TELE|nr:hypothetical protein [Characodon lateralis]
MDGGVFSLQGSSPGECLVQILLCLLMDRTWNRFSGEGALMQQFAAGIKITRSKSEAMVLRTEKMDSSNEIMSHVAVDPVPACHGGQRTEPRTKAFSLLAHLNPTPDLWS